MPLKKLTYFFTAVILAASSIIYGQDSVKTYTLEETVVTGTRLSLNQAKLPASITVVSSSAIEKSTDVNILPLLNNEVPGLFVNSRNAAGYGIGSAASGQISIRGISGSPNTDVLVLIDGQAQYMGIFGHPINDSYLVPNVEKVEVIRGPASLLYGSNALGGAVNIITKRQKDKGFSLGSSLSYGSFNTKEGTGSAGYRHNNFDVTASYAYLSTDGHRKSGNDSFRSNSFFTQAAYSISNNYSININGNFIDAQIFDPGIESMPAENNYFDYTRARTALSFENHFSMTEGAAKIYYNYGKHDIYDGWHSTDDMQGITIYQSIRFPGENIFTAGIDYKDYGGRGENKNMPEQAQLNNGLRKDLSVSETEAYGILQLNPLRSFYASGGIRYTNNSEFGSEITPQFGISYMPDNETTIKANAGKAFRSPTIADMFLFQVANSSLEPERIWSYEVGVTRYFANNDIKTELTFFYLEAENMIRAISSGSGMRKENTGSFNNKGIELSLSLFPGRQFSSGIKYAYTKTGSPVKYAPEHKLNVSLEYTAGIITITSDIQLIQNLFISNIYSEDYFTLSLSAGALITKNISLYVRGNNLTDVQYFIDEGYPSPGISFTSGLKILFNSL
jgi:iron complex outermembrane receptor protein